MRDISNSRRANALLSGEPHSRPDMERWINNLQRAQFAQTCLRDRHGKPWQPYAYQRTSLESMAYRKVHCDGRDVGKTAEIEIIAAWTMMARPHSEMLIATQCENHLFPLMNRLTRVFNDIPGYAPRLVEFKRTPSWFFRFNNGFILWGRIAGPRGMNFQGLHVDWQIVDEAQDLAESSWAELYQALNAQGRRWVYGVPNGRRNDFYHMAKDRYSEHYNWPSSLNPGYTPEKDAELARLYGGRNTPGYIHRVLGQHGTPAHAVFSIEDYLACVDSALSSNEIHLTEEDPFEMSPASPGIYYLGCDLGFSRDPSEFVIYRVDEPYLINTLRLSLTGVNYARQQDILIALDRAHAFRAIGIDAGHSGRAVSHHIMSLGPEWCDRIHTFDFGAMIDLEPFPNGAPNRRRTKEFMTELIARRMAEHTLRFPGSPEREAQYAGHSYTVGPAGQILYEKGNDHIIDADRCALLAHYQDTRVDGKPYIPLMPQLEGF